MGHFWNVNPEATPRQRSRLGQNRPPRTAAIPNWSLSVAIRRTRRQTRRKVGTVFAVALTTFLASAVEAIEMVAIVTGVGATRGWRSALAGGPQALPS
jgi:hypothetical protein